MAGDPLLHRQGFFELEHFHLRRLCPGEDVRIAGYPVSIDTTVLLAAFGVRRAGLPDSTAANMS